MISVIVPAYNIAAYIERCVKSLTAQTYRDLEILLVNDGSTDDTGEICDRLAQQDSRIRVLHKENGGVSSARNLGLRHARGEYISVIDGDDWVEPTLYADCMELIQRCGAQAVMFEYFIDENGQSNRHQVPAQCYGLLTTEQALIHTITPRNRFAWSKFFSAQLLKQHAFDETIILGEDTLFITAVLSEAERVYYTDQAYYHYDQRQNSAVRSNFNMRKLSGLRAYQQQLQMCQKKGFSAAAEYAREALVELAVALAQRASESGGQQASAARKTIKDCIRQEAWPLLTSGKVSIKTKLKTMTALVSIRLTVLLCQCLGN